MDELTAFDQANIENCVQKIANNILLLDVIFLGDLQHVVEAGTGIEPVYTDLQSAA